MALEIISRPKRATKWKLVTFDYIMVNKLHCQPTWVIPKDDKKWAASSQRTWLAVPQVILARGKSCKESNCMSATNCTEAIRDTLLSKTKWTRDLTLIGIIILRNKNSICSFYLIEDKQQRRTTSRNLLNSHKGWNPVCLLLSMLPTLGVNYKYTITASN